MNDFNNLLEKYMNILYILSDLNIIDLKMKEELKYEFTEIMNSYFYSLSILVDELIIKQLHACKSNLNTNKYKNKEYPAIMPVISHKNIISDCIKYLFNNFNKYQSFVFFDEINSQIEFDIEQYLDGITPEFSINYIEILLVYIECKHDEVYTKSKEFTNDINNKISNKFEKKLSDSNKFVSLCAESILIEFKVYFIFYKVFNYFLNLFTIQLTKKI